MRRRASRHFAWSEFGVDARRLDLDTRRGVTRLCDAFLEPLRARYGPVTIHSGRRSRAHNAQVGGAPRSFHLWDERGHQVAVDFSCRRGSPREWYDFLDRRGAPGLGIYPGHVHIDLRDGPRARWG